MFAMQVVESMGWQVEKPVMLKMDNKGGVDLFNNCSIAGRTCHIAAEINFMRESKEQGLIKVAWIGTDNNGADVFAKNPDRKTFERHSRPLVGEDPHCQSQGKSVGGSLTDDIGLVGNDRDGICQLGDGQDGKDNGFQGKNKTLKS